MRSFTIIAATLLVAALPAFTAPLGRRDGAANPFSGALEKVQALDPNDPASIQAVKAELDALSPEQKKLLSAMTESAANADQMFNSLDDGSQKKLEKWILKHLSQAQMAFFVQQLTGTTDVEQLQAVQAGTLPDDLIKKYQALDEAQRRVLMEYALAIETTDEQSDKIDHYIEKAQAAAQAQTTSTDAQVQAKTQEAPNFTTDESTQTAQEETKDGADEKTVQNAAAGNDDDAQTEDDSDLETQAAMIQQYIECANKDDAEALLKEMKANNIDNDVINQLKSQIPSLNDPDWKQPEECSKLAEAAAKTKRSLADLD